MSYQQYGAQRQQEPATPPLASVTIMTRGREGRQYFDVAVIRASTYADSKRPTYAALKAKGVAKLFEITGDSPQVAQQKAEYVLACLKNKEFPFQLGGGLSGAPQTFQARPTPPAFGAPVAPQPQQWAPAPQVVPQMPPQQWAPVQVAPVAQPPQVAPAPLQAPQWAPGTHGGIPGITG